VDLTAAGPAHSNLTYVLRVCGVAQSPYCAAEAGADLWGTSLCALQTTPGWGSEATSLGADTLAPNFALAESQQPQLGVSYTLENEQSCRRGFGAQPQTTLVTLQCGQPMNAAQAQLHVTFDEAQCTVFANVTTQLACGSDITQRAKKHAHHRLHKLRQLQERTVVLLLLLPYQAAAATSSIQLRCARRLVQLLCARWLMSASHCFCLQFHTSLNERPHPLCRANQRAAAGLNEMQR